MAPLRIKSLVLLALVTMVFAMFKGSEAEDIFKFKTKVQIINNLSLPLELTLHCKSKNDDKGEHTLKVGQDYVFGFKPNLVFAVTLYFCNFRWPADPSFHYFDIYIQARDESKCKFCSWKVFEAGACRYEEETKDYTQCYPWNSKPKPLASYNDVPVPAYVTNTSRL